MTEPKDTNSRAAVLERWWMEMAQAESERVIAKALEYGAGDLVEIGRQLVATMDSGDYAEGVKEARYAELGCYFYILGKVARWTSALREGRQVSDDTLEDIGVYVRMVQRIRQAGGWPGI